MSNASSLSPKKKATIKRVPQPRPPGKIAPPSSAPESSTSGSTEPELLSPQVDPAAPTAAAKGQTTDAVLVVMPLPEMTTAESLALADQEEIIDAGLGTFVVVGRALATIQHGRLYRASHATFEAYCLERWGFGKTHAYRQINGAKVVESVPNWGQSATPPTLESHVREVAKLPPNRRAEAWAEAVETAPNGRLTASHVKEVVARRLPADTSTNPVLLRMQSDPKFAGIIGGFTDPKVMGRVDDSVAIPQKLVEEYPAELTGLENFGAVRRAVTLGPPSRRSKGTPAGKVIPPLTASSPGAPSAPSGSSCTATTGTDDSPDSGTRGVTTNVVAFRENVTALCDTFSLVPDDFADLVRLHKWKATTDEFLEALGSRALRHEMQARYDALPKKNTKDANQLRKEMNSADSAFKAFVANIEKRAKG